jgi:hypothetical protein
MVGITTWRSAKAEIDINDVPYENASCATDITKLNFKENKHQFHPTGFSGA